MPTKYISFKNDKPRKIYVLDEKEKWYLREDSTLGFTENTVTQCSHAFLFSETLDGIFDEIKKLEHQEKWGSGKDGDCACPKCGYKYSFDYYDTNDGYYTPAIKEDFKQEVTCICGCKFLAQIEVIVKFGTKVLA